MTPDEIIVMVAELATQRQIPWHVENYQTTRAAFERALRTMSIIPTEPPRQIAAVANDQTAEYPLYKRGVAYTNPRGRF